ncbi:MAG TPA: hypothetical protein VHG92_13340 [Afifellaceae bacterium]|nr:hypothetical protein [Afifellaceae bacterium]
MSGWEKTEWRFWAGLSVAFVLGVQAAAGAVDWNQPVRLAATAEPEARPLDGAADVMLRFIQEGAPDEGLVRVELTPADRPLSAMEARQAAQQAFLEALNEPGLGANLSRILVDVRMAPRSDDPGLRRSFLFLSRGGGSWSIMSAD